MVEDTLYHWKQIGITDEDVAELAARKQCHIGPIPVGTTLVFCCWGPSAGRNELAQPQSCGPRIWSTSPNVC